MEKWLVGNNDVAQKYMYMFFVNISLIHDEWIIQTYDA